MDGQRFCCRLLQVGEKEDVSNEWDRALDATSEDNTLFHWEDAYFWGADISAYDVSCHPTRGWNSARDWGHESATYRCDHLGFRPVLEPLPSDNPIHNINLDGTDFQLTSFSGSDTFYPILQPIQKNIFKGIPVESKVRMYTLTEDGCPIHMDEPVKDPSKLALTDRYYGDEYLVPWVISNGVAVASQSLKQKI